MLDSLRSHLSSLPFLTAQVPPVQGSFRVTPEDFCVEELPAYTPCGQGEHLYVFFEKRGHNTQRAVEAIARQIGARFDQAGWAGLKDRQAVTRQWASFHHPHTPTADSIQLEGIRVLEVSRHANRLRTGHLRGNRFGIRLRDVPEAHDEYVAQVLAQLHAVGLPNYYGEQRFGHDGGNLAGAIRWLVEGGRAPQQPFLRKLFASALQSAMFNVWLGQRVAQGQLASALAGDVMRKEDTGGVFDCSDVTCDGARVAAFEISPTGPMFGASMRSAQHGARAAEDAVLANWGLETDHFARAKQVGEGARRVARVRPAGVAVAREGGDLTLQFELPKGAYATTLVAELLKTRAPSAGDDA